MEKRSKVDYRSFNIKSYKLMLQAAVECQYEFVFFGDQHQYDKCILLRHDIDADLTSALKLAKIENKMGVKSTYFLMINSAVYNLFSRVNMAMVKKILELGHQIGLHYDDGYHYHKKFTLQESVDLESEFLSHQFDQVIKVVSFHQPSKSIIDGSSKIHDYINTYDKDDMKGIHYISDSNMVWRAGHPSLTYEKGLHKKIQVLIHPMWWARKNEIESSSIIWDNILMSNLEITQQFLHSIEGAYKNPGTISIEHI